MKSALIIGHAGHELRVLKFIQLFKPMVFILTDGSGANGQSRIESTKKILKDLGCPFVRCFFSDKDIYELILKNQYEKFIDIRNEMHQQMMYHGVDFVFGDACEGFNPTHDLCRYIINSCIENNEFKNYDFLLDNSPCFNSSDVSNITLKLSKSDKNRRDELISGYPEIQQEIEFAKQKFGEADFDYECLREVENYEYKNWKGDKPFYETYAQKKFKEGKYSKIITYQHLLDISEHL